MNEIVVIMKLSIEMIFISTFPPLLSIVYQYKTRFSIPFFSFYDCYLAIEYP